MAHDLLYINSKDNPSNIRNNTMAPDDKTIEKKDFDVKKTFGLSVLLKLTRKSVNGVRISETNGRYRSNLDLDEMNKAVTMTMEAHNISLKVG